MTFALPPRRRLSREAGLQIVPEEAWSFADNAIYCAVCDRWLNGRAQYDDHLRSGRHIRLARLQMTSSSSVALVTIAAPIAVSAPEEGAVQCGVCEFWLNGRAQYDHHLKGRKHATRLKRLARLQDECKSFARLHQTQSFLSRELELVSNYLMRRRPESSPASQSCQLGTIASWQRSEFRKEVSQSISAMRVCSRGVRSHVVISLLEYWIGTLRRS